MKREIKVIIIVVFLFTIEYCKGQAFYIEAHFGHDLFAQNLISSQRINNILILPATENLGEPLFGIKTGGDIHNKLSWQLRADLGWAFYSFGVLDLMENCNFCPVTKALGTGGRRLDVSISPRYSIIELGAVHLFGYGGISFSSTEKIEKEEFQFNGRFLRTAEMMTKINDSFGKSIFLYNLGVALEYKRITLDLIFYRQLSNSTSSGFFFEGEPQQFVNRQNVTALTIGYKIIKKE